MGSRRCCRHLRRRNGALGYDDTPQDTLGDALSICSKKVQGVLETLCRGS